MHYPYIKGEVIFETIRQGRFVKVTAIDTISGIEASIVGDPSTPPEQLQQIALQKLNYVLGKEQS